MKLTQKTVVFGIGAMGSALLKGWISSKLLKSSLITALDVDRAKCKKMAEQFKIKTEQNPTKALKDAQLILLAVKPQQMKNLLEEAGKLFPENALVVSIAAGVSTDRIENALPQGCPVVRVMPNTPALLGAGMAAVAGGKRAKSAHIKLVLNLFSAVGQSVCVSENQMDLITAISGSGPAYIFHMVEVMIEAGVKGGLPLEIAHQLVAQTVFGAARMILETGKTPEALRQQVTSPGGTTEAALKKFAEKGFREIVHEAIEAATLRGAELRKMTN